jgi:hypothetical protein
VPIIERAAIRRDSDFRICAIGEGNRSTGFGIKINWEKLLPPEGFQVLPRRWVVEHKFSWPDQNRRMSKDYERLPETSEAFIYVAMSRLMARRLACS